MASVRQNMGSAASVSQGMDLVAVVRRREKMILNSDQNEWKNQREKFVKPKSMVDSGWAIEQSSENLINKEKRSKRTGKKAMNKR